MHANALPIPLLAEGAGWMAVSKPAHLLVHPTRPGGPVTLIELLREFLACEVAAGDGVALVHRLDRETSGVVLVAKSASAARHFGRAWTRAGEVRKEYLAIVRGWPEWDTREVDAALLRAGEVGPTRIWLKQTVHPRGAAACTQFEVLRRFRRADARDGDENCALVRALPRTGRLHQIRVHAAETGHPLVGDKIYGPDETLYLKFIETGWTPQLARALWLDRHALHASRLEFTEPAGARVAVSAPLPAEMAEFLGQCVETDK